MVEEAKCIAAMQWREGLRVTGSAVLALSLRLELLQRVSVLGGSSKCSELCRMKSVYSILGFRTSALIKLPSQDS